MKTTRQERAMVCAECFRAKGESELKAPCQNPKCYFYLRTQSPNNRTLDTEVNALSFSLANELTFNREVGSKARAASYSTADMFMPPHVTSSGQHQQVLQRSNSLWGFPLEPATSMSRSDLNMHPDRTSSYGSRVATNSHTVRGIVYNIIRYFQVLSGKYGTSHVSCFNSCRRRRCDHSPSAMQAADSTRRRLPDPDCCVPA